jgi:hypothetical protein
MEVDALFETKPEAALAVEPLKVEPEVVQPEAEAPIAPTPEPEVQPEPVAPEVPKTVPLATFLDARDEAKELKRRVEEYEAKASQAAPSEMPDPYDDPTGFASWQTSQVNQALTAQKFNMSDVMAKRDHGAEVVEAAGLWAAEKARTDPGFYQSYMNEPHPIDWIVRQHKQDGLISDIGGNVDEWFAREAVKRGYFANPAPTAALVAVPQQQVAPTPEPPRSLAATPAKGGGVKDIPVGPLSAVDGLFTR